MMLTTLLAVLLVALLPAAAQELRVYPEFQRPSIHGDVIAADRGGGTHEIISPAVPRNGYTSFFLVAKLPAPGPYRLRVVMNPASVIQAELYRVWFHKLEGNGEYYPDALIPVKTGYDGQIPDADNKVPGQTAAVFWLDLFVPRGARPQRVRVEAQLAGVEHLDTYPMEVRILPVTIPDADALDADHNSYSANWLADMFPQAARAEGSNFFRSGRYFELIHAYHRGFYEHRGIFHQLGYGHAGKVAPEFAPALAGSGRNKHIASWELYDRHYGPLFDGSAFQGTRRGPRPIPYVYLPINPEWPANFLYWGEPGYEAEFVNVVSEMEKHFREKGWTHTRLEMFFNHKKRYKGFPWDGDEVRFLRDEEYFRRFGALLHKAVPAGSPVPFIFRADCSWAMERQFSDLAGVLNLWVVGGGEFSFYPAAPAMLHQRGDTVWFYGSAAGVKEPAAASVYMPLRAWMWGVDGYVLWLVTGSGNDPWFHFNGGRETMVYPGEKFGIEGPIPSLRLKIERNALQDIALLKALEAKLGREKVREEVARLTGRHKPDDWWTIPRPKLADQPPEEWSNTDIGEAERPMQRPYQNLAPDWWLEVRRWIYRAAREGGID
ncbi:MAG TPA: hypothetical protein VEU62_21355 [Bryobacterales bacterium]|nr:hypothetical protein [Bryobacterales bacterium]